MSKKQTCKNCLYRDNNKDDNTCGFCNLEWEPHNNWTPRIKRIIRKENIPGKRKK